jgi:ABC-2 type transport system ATP-binding protein
VNQPSTPALQVQGVSVRFGSRVVLDRLSLAAQPGRLTAVLGPNGAGKTTLVRCCTGLLQPDSGSINVLGGPAGRPEAAARVGLMPQSTGAWSGVRAGELLRYLAALYAHPHDVDALMARCGVADVAGLPYRRLSGGQQQAVNLAGALIGRPELVFLDEPTAGLDPHARHAIWQLLDELRRAGVGIVLTTHAMDEAQRLADQVYILDRGRLAVSGTVPELTRDGRTLEAVFLANTRLGAAS